MKKTKRLMSVVLSLAMVISLFTFAVPAGVSAAAGNVGDICMGDSSVSITVGATDDTNMATLETDIYSIGGKTGDDAAYKITVEKGGTEGRNTIFPSVGFGINKRAIISFDIMFTDNTGAFYVGYGAASEGATDFKSYTNINKFLTVSARYGISAGTQFTVENETPTSISKNQWHNFAIEIAGDGSSDANVYLDGVKYEGAISTASYGSRHLRISVGKDSSVIYIDNYHAQLLENDGESDFYAEENYLAEEISITGNDKVTYDEDTKLFTITDSSLTAEELISSISAAEGFSVAVFEDTLYKTELSGTDLVTMGNSVVVSNGSVYRYYGFERTNDSIFEYTDNGDNYSATVTGFKEENLPDGTSEVDITIPDKIAGYTVTDIGDGAFRDIDVNDGVLTLPDTVRTIGANAFYNTYCTLGAWPSSLERIGSSAFVHDKITVAEFPESLKVIGGSAFQYANIVSPVLNDGLTTIGAHAFEWDNVTEFIIPDSVTSMGDNVLRTTYNWLTKVRFPRNDTFTAIPENTFSSRYDDNESYFFGNLKLYIPENVTTIPTSILSWVKSTSTVTIYGAYDSAAHNFYTAAKAGIADGTIVNGAGNAIAGIKFVEYDFENDITYEVNEDGINTGDEAVGLGTKLETTTFTENTPGIGGKTADDVVLHMQTMGGSAGENFIGSSGSDGVFYAEFSAMAPASGEIRSQVGYYITADKKDTIVEKNDGYYNKEAIPVRITANAIYVYGTKVMDAVAGRWYTIALEVKNDSTTATAVYVNGVKHEGELTYGSYGVRHFRIYPTTSTEQYNLYFDNWRYYTSASKIYNPKGDMLPEVTAADDTIRIYKGGIVYADETASYTVSELVSKLVVNESADASVRVYSDSSFKTLLEDGDVVSDGAVVVIAAKNGYFMERAYAYLPVNPPINTTLFDMSVISEADKTAMVTGFLEENITETDDLSAIAIPEEILGYKIIAIGESAFENESIIQSVTIPDTVERIENYAFAGNQVAGTSGTNGNILSVDLSENLKYIGTGAFKCNPIEYIELPEGLETIGNQAFYWTNLKELSIPNSVTKLGGGVARLCSKLEYIKLPTGISSVSADCFYGPTKIKDIVVPENITSISEGVFASYDMDMRVHGVKGSYAEQWAEKYGFEFVEVIANTLLVKRGIFGDGEKELLGSTYDLDYGYETLTFKGRLVNIGSDDTEANVIVALYDETGAMLQRDLLGVTIPAGKTVDITAEDGVTIPAGKIKEGYKAKAFVWRKGNNEPIVDAVEVTFDRDNVELHVLAIANSFCNDSFAYINAIALADGVTLKVQNMYIGGAKITQHYNNLLTDAPNYQPVIDMVYGDTKITMKEALKSDKWTVVALQGATHGHSADYAFVDYETWADDGAGTSTGTPNLTTEGIYSYIENYVETYAPTAKKIMHMSWSPSTDQSMVMYGGRFATEADPRGAMFEAQKAAYEYASTIFADEPNMMVPSSYAVQYALNELGFLETSGEKSSSNTYPRPVEGEVSIYRDTTCHLTTGTHPYGRVLAGLTWYEYLTGNDVRENPYQNSGISEEVMAQLKEAAHWANTQVVPITGSGE